MTRWLRRTMRGDSGISLAELMVSLLVTAIMAGLVVGWIVSVHTSDENERQIQEALDQMMVAKSRMTKEIRYADGVVDDPLATHEHQVMLWIDKEGAGIGGAADYGIGEFITWRFDPGGTLTRLSDDPAEPDSVVAYDLVYSDPVAAGSSSFEYPSTDRVIVNLVADVNPGSSPSPQSIATEVFLRNG